jgi:uncharacterized protein YjbJ (UPF0337 family)
MDWDRIEGSWNEFKGKARSQWGQLTDDDLAQIEGRRGELVGKLQARYGYTKDRARQEIERWLANVDGGLAAPATAVKDDVVQVADNFSKALRKSLSDNPRATIAMAAVLGFVLGALWRS